MPRVANYPLRGIHLGCILDHGGLLDRVRVLQEWERLHCRCCNTLRPTVRVGSSHRERLTGARRGVEGSMGCEFRGR